MKDKLLISVLFTVMTGCVAAQDTPNIILIMADDLGWGDTGFNGSETVKTPNLDQLAGAGIQFNRFYSASAVCSPTRASVLTGRNPYRTGVFSANQGILRPEEITLPEVLGESGYTSGHFGKWHLGTLNTTEKDGNRGRAGNEKEFNPPSVHGFDYCFSTESKVPTWNPMLKPPKGKGNNENDEGAQEETFYGTWYHDIEGNIVRDNLEGDDSRVIMDRVLPFIENAAQKDKPFLAVIWFHTPHKPYVAGPEYKKMYSEYDDDFQNYAGAITAMDEQVGRLHKYLEENHLSENTIIWFCSDNGPENKTPGTTGGFRERKRSLHDGGIRVPGFLYWPAGIKAHRLVEDAVVTSDIMPTLLEITGNNPGNLPNVLDGTSILPLIKEKPFVREHPVYFVLGNQVAGIDTRYKLYARSGSFELYDMTSDPYETTDLISEKSQNATSLQTFLMKMKWLEDCRKSFEGAEYGTESYDRMKQRWHDPLDKNTKTELDD